MFSSETFEYLHQPIDSYAYIQLMFKCTCYVYIYLFILHYVYMIQQRTELVNQNPIKNFIFCAESYAGKFESNLEDGITSSITNYYLQQC